MNVCNFIGRVGRDAVVRFTQGRKAVTGWSLAVDRGWGDNKQTTWIDCSLWGERGERVADYIKKGAQLGVSGEIGTREHEGKTYVTLDVREVSLIGGKPEGEQRGGGASRGGAPQRQRPQRATASVTDDSFADDDIPFATNRSTF